MITPFRISFIIASLVAADGTGQNPSRGTVVFSAEAFDRDTAIEAEKLVLTPNAKVRLAPGIRLTIRAKVLEIRGPASFEGRGEKGVDGSPGGNAGVWTSTGACWREQGHKDWLGSGQANLAHERGGNGTNGGNGSAGASVTIQYQTVVGDPKLLTFQLTGGQPGAGGAGGRGMELRCGCHPNETKYGPSGSSGSGGAAGANGTVLVTDLLSVQTPDGGSAARTR